MRVQAEKKRNQQVMSLPTEPPVPRILTVSCGGEKWLQFHGRNDFEKNSLRRDDFGEIWVLGFQQPDSFSSLFQVLALHHSSWPTSLKLMFWNAVRIRQLDRSVNFETNPSTLEQSHAMSLLLLCYSRASSGVRCEASPHIFSWCHRRRNWAYTGVPRS